MPRHTFSPFDPNAYPYGTDPAEIFRAKQIPVNVAGEEGKWISLKVAKALASRLTRKRMNDRSSGVPPEALAPNVRVPGYFTVDADVLDTFRREICGRDLPQGELEAEEDELEKMAAQLLNTRRFVKQAVRYEYGDEEIEEADTPRILRSSSPLEDWSSPESGAGESFVFQSLSRELRVCRASAIYNTGYDSELHSKILYEKLSEDGDPSHWIAQEYKEGMGVLTDVVWSPLLGVPVVRFVYGEVLHARKYDSPSLYRSIFGQEQRWEAAKKWYFAHPTQCSGGPIGLFNALTGEPIATQNAFVTTGSSLPGMNPERDKPYSDIHQLAQQLVLPLVEAARSMNIDFGLQCEFVINSNKRDSWSLVQARPSPWNFLGKEPSLAMRNGFNNGVNGSLWCSRRTQVSLPFLRNDFRDSDQRAFKGPHVHLATMEAFKSSSFHPAGFSNDSRVRGVVNFTPAHVQIAHGDRSYHKVRWSDEDREAIRRTPYMTLPAKTYNEWDDLARAQTPMKFVSDGVVWFGESQEP